MVCSSSHNGGALPVPGHEDGCRRESGTLRKGNTLIRPPPLTITPQLPGGSTEACLPQLPTCSSTRRAPLTRWPQTLSPLAPDGMLAALGPSPEQACVPFQLPTRSYTPTRAHSPRHQEDTYFYTRLTRMSAHTHNSHAYAYTHACRLIFTHTHTLTQAYP